IGTQLKVERPGKAAAITTCTTIEGSVVKLKDPQKPGIAIIQVDSPYIITGAQVSGSFSKSDNSSSIYAILSLDEGENWHEVWRHKGKGTHEESFSLDNFMAGQESTTFNTDVYKFWLRFVMEPSKQEKEISISDLVIKADIQLHPRSLPTLAMGDNTFYFTTEDLPGDDAAVLFEWWENHGLEISNHRPLEGEEVIIKAEIKNRGHKEATDFFVRLYEGYPEKEGRLIEEKFLPILRPDEKAKFEFRWKARVHPDRGQGRDKKYVSTPIVLSIDGEDKIEEANKDNNQAVAYITVLPRPDLQVKKEYVKVIHSSEEEKVIFPVFNRNDKLYGNSSPFLYVESVPARDIEVQVYDLPPRDGGKPLTPVYLIPEIYPTEHSIVEIPLTEELQKRGRFFLVVDPQEKLLEERRENNFVEIKL
ncbi:MAG: hypothetical protein HY730_04275, partial [Candidatus Tectomicrobia bacterium]|nr:hypothetical protein [Candidatus Tectomicrobia bacterium]